MNMKVFRVTMRSGELAVSTISTVLKELHKLSFGDMMDRLWTLSRDRKWVALLGVMADFAWQHLPKHKWMTQEQAMSILGWDDDLVAAAFFRLTRRPRGRRARRWSGENRYVLLLPTDTSSKATELATRACKPHGHRFRVAIPQRLSNPLTPTHES